MFVLQFRFGLLYKRSKFWIRRLFHIHCDWFVPNIRTGARKFHSWGPNQTLQRVWRFKETWSVLQMMIKKSHPQTQIKNVTYFTRLWAQMVREWMLRMNSSGGVLCKVLYEIVGNCFCKNGHFRCLFVWNRSHRYMIWWTYRIWWIAVFSPIFNLICTFLAHGCIFYTAKVYRTQLHLLPLLLYKALPHTTSLIVHTN